MPRLAAAVGPCATDLRSQPLTADSRIRRAIAALKAGRPVRIEHGPSALALLPVETATDALLQLLDPEGKAPRKITDLDNEKGSLVWSPDAKTLLPLVVFSIG